MITDLLGIPLTDIVQAIGYAGIFFIVFAESGLPFGFIFPGDTLLFVAGLLASQGVFSIVPLLLLTTSAAMLGDSAGYALGNRFGKKLFKKNGRWFFNERTIQKTEAFYARYGVRALIFARFVPTVRTFVPIFAGIGSMQYRTFVTYNIIGGLLWGTGVTFLGYALGNTIPNIDKYVHYIIIGIIVASALPLLYESFQLYKEKRQGTKE